MRVGGLRGALYTLCGLLVSYGFLIYDAGSDEVSLADRIYDVVDRTAWHNATARPPVILVLVVLGWSVVVRRCRRSGMRLELVLGPGSILPARAIFRCAVVLLNVVLFSHLFHFVIERRAGSSQPWYLVSDVLLHVLIIGVFLSPPALASALARRPSDMSFDDPSKSAREDAEEEDDSRGVLYPDARAGLARAMRDTLAAPCAPVTFWHVIVADYATSLAKALGDFQITACVAYNALRVGRLQSSDELFNQYKPTCGRSLANAVALGLPFWCRLAQCIRVYLDTAERKNLVNALKYCSAFPLVLAGYFQKHAESEEVLRLATRVVIGAAIVNSSFSFGWDVVMDWGLLRPKRRAIILGSYNPLVVAAAYVLLLAFNLTMRFAWAIAVFSHTSTLNYGMFTLEVVEILRRTVWAVFRIELEYIVKGMPVMPVPQKAIQLGGRTRDNDVPDDTDSLIHRVDRSADP
mmetsp:Transcript_21979/g.68788  ORF Transcript_21979/g.68788 Transcript_21979/m.68788 type:complete len:464 (-) Transcript_21979:355-1746(-)